ncbi:uncharacterized protein LOC122497662 [Leptopilina heterotoma]|uniref:uncharacterized protein LOC122497662 n=1 Tax=Leptopilina heterotoma TaxID=63436 RepID=UPI001CA8AE0E|nr:uncharacterized protein LOC122497662 [Leptopilina heterotoma]
MISSIVSRVVILVFGTLYPAYASYKAVRTKNVKEYVKWMMYWIVFALFTCAETFTDVFFSFWFPFYYEIKIVLVLWLLSPATKGSSILYRRFVHPALSRREAEIDEALARATEQGYTAVLHLGSKGVNYATTVLMQTAIKGGGGLVQQLKKSYSLSDLSGEKEDENRNTPNSHDETDMQVEPRRREHTGRRGYSPRRTQSTNNRVEMYFSEVDVEVRQPRSKEPLVSLNNIRSSEDISSGYSSGEALHNHRPSIHSDSLVRTSSVGGRTRLKPRSTTKKAPEEEEEDSDNNLPFPDEKNPPPNPLTFLSVEQALDLVSLLSYHLARNNCTNFNEKDLQTLSNINETCEIEKIEEDEKNIMSIPKIVTSVPIENKTSDADVTKFTDDICREKFDELKKLLSNAHKAVSNIVSSQESLAGEIDDETRNVSKNFVNKMKIGGDLSGIYGSVNSLEVWSTPNISRSNSDSECNKTMRAGKYHKKPAPKIPTIDNKTIDNDTDSQKAVKATLVIKTGTIKSFTDLQQLKRKKVKSRSREGFSKLLTVPKNFFHNAFHKENKDRGKYDDTSSINSDCSDSPSRSSSIGSQNTPTDDDTLTPSTEFENEKFTDKEKINDNNVGNNLENKNENFKTDDKIIGENLVSSVEEINVLKSDEGEEKIKNVEDIENTSQIFRARLRIREMSRSPNRCSRKSYSEE